MTQSRRLSMPNAWGRTASKALSLVIKPQAAGSWMATRLVGRARAFAMPITRRRCGACVRLSFSLARSRSRLLSKGTKLIENERAGVRTTRRTATATMAVRIGPRRHLALVCVEKHLDKKHVRECSLDLQRKIQSSIARSICTYTHTRTHTHTQIFCKYNFASPLTNTHLRRKCCECLLYI